jgi:hypothetical protein
MGIAVNVDNFARAESDRMLAGLVHTAGGAVNQWFHFRQPTPLDQHAVSFCSAELRRRQASARLAVSQRPLSPSICSGMMSAWPACRAVS